jgi:hypothetical protein
MPGAYTISEPSNLDSQGSRIMRVNRQISSALVMVFVLLLSTSLPATAESRSLVENSSAVFTTIDFVSNIETIGVAVNGTSLPPTAELFYRKSGETLWHPGHPLMRIDGGRLIGSLFNLSPATSYDIKVLDGYSEINGSVVTQPDQLSFTPSMILYVNDDALPGGDGSTATPFQTIQEAVDHAGPGTQVLVADGVYREAVTFPVSGTAGNWIQVKASGNAAIMDSADRLSGDIWTPHESKAHVWYKKIDGPVAYLARDGKRYYQYDDRTGLMEALGHGGVNMNEGWYYESSTLKLYIRSLDDPANHTWQLPRLNHAFDLIARDWIWIEGFEIRFYGTTTNGCGVCTTNASHIVIRRNKIHNMQLGIFINWNGTTDQGNDTRIEQNEVYDPFVDEWPWTAVKGSFMEGTGIIIRGHIGAIVRDNNVHNFFNGIYTGSSGALENPELAFDADIYRNYIHHISDDALEPEGACINHRFRNNTIDRSFIGVSLAPITQGPTWVLRSTFTSFTGRGVKLANNSDGIVLIYQNTGWTSASSINGMDLITPVHNIVMRNNIFQSTGYSFAEGSTGSTGNDWNHNNWYTTRGSTGPHFKWENINYSTISSLCNATGLECNGYEDPPGFTNPAGGDFTLLPSSPNINRGVVIPGINDDFTGNAPDVGAHEFASDPPPIVLSSVRVNSNPTDADYISFMVTFSEFVTGVNNTDFALTISGITGASVANVSGTGTTYTITVNTGFGNGEIRLDVVDDDSIKDVNNIPLGGAGAGNGNYTGGETYTINKLFTITGNAGAGGTVLSYVDGTSKTVIAGSNGAYIITIFKYWSGTVTPSHPCYTFDPPNRSYTNLASNQTAQNYSATFNPASGCANINVDIGGNLMGSYAIPPGQEKREFYPASGGPVKVTSTNTMDIIAAIRLQSMNSGILLDYNETMGIPEGSLSTKYIFPVYENKWAPLNSQLRFAHLGAGTKTIKVTIGTETWTYDVAEGQDKRIFLDRSGGPVIVESLDGVTKIVAAIRLQSMSNNVLNAYSETFGIPIEDLSTRYYFPVYENLWAPLNSQLRFAHLGVGTKTIKVTIGSESWTYDVAEGEDKRIFLDRSGGPVIIESLDGVTKVIAAIRLQSMKSGTLLDYNETMGIPAGSLSTKYIFPVYENLWAPLNSQLRFAHLGAGTKTIKVTIGTETWTYDVAEGEDKRIFLARSGGPVIVESLDGVTQIVAAIRLQCMKDGLLNCYSETMGIPFEFLSDTYYFPVYENLWTPLNSQVRFGAP